MAAPLKWFPLYVDDFDTDGAVRLMTNEEVGIFVRMLCWQWREGFLPDDARALARAFSARRATVQRLLKAHFQDDGHKRGQLINRRLAEVYVHQLSKSQKASEAGRRSADKRRTVVERTLQRRSESVAPEVEVDVRSEIQKSLSVARAQEATA